jgi:DNA-binding protein HU-beta
MNKADLINSISKKTGLSKSKTNEVIDAFVESVTDSLKKGEKVTLVNFGTFNISERDSRSGRNPKTGETIEIPAKRVARFKVGSGLAKNIN